ALEAETFSGISAFESAASTQPLPPDALGDHRFWLTQIPDSDLRSISDALKQAGANMLGVAHPAVPTVDTPQSPTEEWRSLQNWDEATLLVRGCGEAIADFHSMSSGLQSQRTVQEFQSFFDGQANTSPLQWLGPTALPPALSELCGHRKTDTTAEPDLNKWAAAWMRTQAKQTATAPLVTIPKQPMSREAGIAIAAVLGLLMMVGCYLHYRYLKAQFDQTEANIAAMTKQEDQLKEDSELLKRIQKETKEAKEQAESLRNVAAKGRAQVAEAEQIIQDGGRRWLALVDSLMEVSDQEGWIQEIKSNEGAVAIRGSAISDSAVHRLAARMESTSAAKQWQILPAATKVNEETNLIEFTIDLLASNVPPTSSIRRISNPATSKVLTRSSRRRSRP
ncbi:MAG: hypothetical protein AAGG44_20515, partial [Planctomycetota bacterium]